MIVSASHRTDIPAFYPTWFRRRLEAGWCKGVNAFSGKAYTVDLSPEGCDGFVFWTKNAGPFMDALAEVQARGFPFVVQYTLTAYPRALETSVIDAEGSIARMHEIAERFGPAALVWRYDPVLFSEVTPPRWHRDTVAWLAERLEGTSDEAVFSVAQLYRKMVGNTNAAAEKHGFTWWNPSAGEKTALLDELARTVQRHGFAPRLCAQPELRPDPLLSPLAPARCIDAERLARVAGRAIGRQKAKGARNGCECHQARDIGAYDTCPHGCCYCYAVQHPDIAKRRYRAHDPDSEFLVPPGRDNA